MKKTPYATIRALYGELEAARRIWEDEGELDWKRRSAGGQAYVLWLELLDIAEWLSGQSGADDDDEDPLDPLEGQDDLPDGGSGQIDLPGTGDVDGVVQNRVHQATGVHGSVAPDELLQQPLPGTVGRAVAGLKPPTSGKQKVRFATPK